MKKLLIISIIISLCLTACASNEIPANANNADIENSNTEKTDKKVIEVDSMSVDGVRRSEGISDEEVLDQMLEKLRTPEKSKSTNTSSHRNILLGEAVEIVYGEWSKGEIGESRDVGYLFKITDNLTGSKLPEYIKVHSNHGDVFEIGKEYIINPWHAYSTLHDKHILSDYFDIISRDLLSESDINRLRKEGAAAKEKNKSELNFAGNVVIEKASLQADFISNLDLAATITVIEKHLEVNSDHIYDVKYEVVDVLSGKKYSFILDGEEMLRLNTDVEVGGTYLVMLEVFEDSWVLPVARSGAVVSEKDEDFAKYKEAFLKVSS